jgi:hypothetical protein
MIGTCWPGASTSQAVRLAITSLRAARHDAVVVSGADKGRGDGAVRRGGVGMPERGVSGLLLRHCNGWGAWERSDHDVEPF